LVAVKFSVDVCDKPAVFKDLASRYVVFLSGSLGHSIYVDLRYQ